MSSTQGRLARIGVLYGVALRGLQVRRALVYRGMFGTGLFQSLYTPPAAHWAMVPTTLEWHIATLVVADRKSTRLNSSHRT